MSAIAASPNFGFLALAHGQLTKLGALAERYFSDDPVVCLIRLRQFGEVLAQEVAARTGAFTSTDEKQADLLRRLSAEGTLDRDVLDLFHAIRRADNEATHDDRGDHATALTCLKLARQLAVWFHRTFSDALIATLVDKGQDRQRP